MPSLILVLYSPGFNYTRGNTLDDVFQFPFQRIKVLRSSSSIVTITCTKATLSTKIIVTFSVISQRGLSPPCLKSFHFRMRWSFTLLHSKSHRCVFFPKKQIVTSSHQINSFYQEKNIFYSCLTRIVENSA